MPFIQLFQIDINVHICAIYAHVLTFTEREQQRAKVGGPGKLRISKQRRWSIFVCVCAEGE